LAFAGCAPATGEPDQAPNAPYQEQDPRDTSGMRQKPAIVRTDVSTWRPDTSPPATRVRAHARPEAPPKIKG
jgi:hypothetical protein